MMNKEDFRPFFTMWVKPRETIREVKDSNKYITFLAIIGGISIGLNSASREGLGDGVSILGILFLSITLGGLLGIFYLYIASAIIKWTGKWIGGEGTFEEIRRAYAWTNVTAFGMLLLWIPYSLLYGKEIFMADMPSLDTSSTLAISFNILGGIELLLSIWTFVITVVSISEVQDFSVWKAIGNIILSGLVAFIPLLLFAGCVSLLAI